MIGDQEKKSPNTEIGILHVRLHQIGIRGRIWTYLAKGYNFTIVSCVFALKKKKNGIFNNIYVSVSVSISVAAVCCLCISYKRTDTIPYPYTLRKRSYVCSYLCLR